MTTPATPPTPSWLFRLADEFRLLRTSPAWDSVQGAIAKLEIREAAKLRTDALEQEKGLVFEYQSLLKSNLTRIAEAMVVGAAVGSIARSEPREAQLAAGLRAISEGHHFRTLDDKEVDRVLAIVRLQLLDRVTRLTPNAPPPSPTGPFGGMPISVSEDPLFWGPAMAAEVASARAAVSAISPTDCSASAWATLEQRCGAPGNSLPPTIDELFCAAGNLLPYTKFGLDPSALSIMTWAEALNDTTMPAWVASAAAARLGFTREDAALLPRFANGSPPLSDSFFKPVAEPVVRALIIPRRADSLFAQWVPKSGFMLQLVDPASVDFMPADERRARETARDARGWRHDYYRFRSIFNSSLASAMQLQRLRPFGHLRFTHIVVEGHKIGSGTRTWQLMAAREMVDGGPNESRAKVLLVDPLDTLFSADVSPIEATVISKPTSLEDLFGVDPSRPATSVAPQ